MRSVKIGEAKNNFSRHLAYVKRGGRVRIFDRDKPVADLVPVDTSEASTADDELLADLERSGLVRRGKSGPLPREILTPGPRDPSARLLQALLEERRRSR
jgi:antitoxin (DNA-binding transcriptional repressor) of toxin-antitoxin stability system